MVALILGYALHLLRNDAIAIVRETLFNFQREQDRLQTVRQKYFKFCIIT